jgi:hypothetical protein
MKYKVNAFIPEYPPKADLHYSKVERGLWHDKQFESCPRQHNTKLLHLVGRVNRNLREGAVIMGVAKACGTVQTKNLLCKLSTPKLQMYVVRTNKYHIN